MKKNTALTIISLIMIVIMFCSLYVTPISASADSSDVSIIMAEYRNKTEKRDVKAVISGMLDANGKIEEFVVSNSSLGCSLSGEDNYLLVGYVEDNVTKYASVKQGKKFSIPFIYDAEQLDETNELLNKPLTSSTKEKVWPSTGVRGFNFGGLVGSYSANPGNEGMYVTEETFKRLKSWGVNCLRIPIAADGGYDWVTETIPEDDPVAPYRHHLEGLKIALHLAEKYDMWIIPSGDNVVGRQIDIMYNGSDGSGYNETLKQLWIYIAKNYGTHPRLLGYDLLNEPNTSNDVAYYMDTVLPMLVNAIREIDKNTYLIIEPATFALPGYFSSLKPIDDPKAVYSFHFYWPHQYTHQGIGDYNKEFTYPGMMGNFPTDAPVLWNKARMKDSVKAVVDFQKKYNATIWIGEFGAVRWGGNPAQWIKDTISIWEEYGWDWCYHSYGGYNGFNQTFDEKDEPNNVMDGGKDTDAIKALIAGFAFNGKPRKNVSTTTPPDTSSPQDSNSSSASKPQDSVTLPDGDYTSKDDTVIDLEDGSVTVLTGSGIKVASASLSKDWSLEASRIAKGKEYEAIKAVLPAGTKGFAIYNLNILDENNEKITPDSKLEVLIPLNKGMGDVVLYYIDDNYNLVPLEAYISEDGVAFETDKLGNFVILKSSGEGGEKYILNIASIILIAVASALALGEIAYLIISSILRKKRGNS